MYQGHKIAVVVPAYNEEKLIPKAISTVPPFVDRIIVVDDGSTDETNAIASSFKEDLGDKLIVITHSENRGLGSAIITGYKKALEEDVEMTAVMAGDAQMEPKDLPSLLDPIIEDSADYVKGNRLLTPGVRKKMPRFRFFGNAILTLLTKIASGYWNVMDPQNGYTATSKEVLKILDLDSIYKGYGYNNDILTKLNVSNFRVKDVTTTPVYGEEKSGINIFTYTIRLSLLLLRKFLWRLKEKYVIRDFHPLIFFYISGFIFLPLGMLIGLEVIYTNMRWDIIPMQDVILCVLLIITGVQSLSFAMLFDMQSSASR